MPISFYEIILDTGELEFAQKCSQGVGKGEQWTFSLFIDNGWRIEILREAKTKIVEVIVEVGLGNKLIKNCRERL